MLPQKFKEAHEVLCLFLVEGGERTTNYSSPFRGYLDMPHTIRPLETLLRYKVPEFSSVIFSTPQHINILTISLE